MNNIDWEILLKHLNGESSSEEEKSLNSWISLSADNKTEYEAIRKIWNSPDIDYPKPDTYKALQIVKERLNILEDNKQNEKAKIFRLSNKQESRSFIQKIFTQQYIRAAAVILVILSAVFYLTDIFNTTKMIEVDVNFKTIQKVTLADGSIITLDVGSSFKYPEKFTGDLREVFLNGEAFFDVAKNKSKAFVVKANNAVVTVLGTKFNIRAWDIDKRVEVAVSEGTVSLHSEGSKGKDKVVLLKGQASTLAENGLPRKPEFVDIDEYVSWIKREKYFRNSPVFEVVDQIERWYNIDIELPHDFNKSDKISMQIKNIPIEDVLDLFSAIVNLNYKIDGKIVKFTDHK